MTAPVISVPRALWIAGLVGLVACASYLVAPRIVTSYVAPVENTHLLPEQHEAFRRALAEMEKTAALIP